MAPETTYVKCGGLHIAYQVIGEGDVDLVYVPGWVSHVELAWEEPTLARFLFRLASFSRLIIFDKRGTGLSDRVADRDLPTLEERMQDLKCVLDAVGSRRAALFGFSEGGNLCALFAATYPEKVAALALFGVFAKRVRSPDYPWAPDEKSREEEYARIEKEWGREMDLAQLIPGKMDDKAFISRMATYFRRAASPSAAVALLKMNTTIDIRHILPSIQVPTLIMHRTGDLESHIDEGRWIANQVPGAQFIELDGSDHLPWVGNQEEVLDILEEFITGVKPKTNFDRVFSNILFTDIVASTEKAASLGDTEWRKVLHSHNAIARQCILQYQGQEIDNTGDGFLVTFEGPLKAMACASAMLERCRSLGLQLRAGIHSGEIHKIGSEISGIAIHIAARIVDLAPAEEILISGSTRAIASDLGYHFLDRGSHVLKGVPDPCQVFSVVSP